LTKEKIDRIIDEHLIGGNIVNEYVIDESVWGRAILLHLWVLDELGALSYSYFIETPLRPGASRRKSCPRVKRVGRQRTGKAEGIFRLRSSPPKKKKKKKKNRHRHADRRRQHRDRPQRWQR